jgi:hypothetical protein
MKIPLAKFIKYRLDLLLGVISLVSITLLIKTSGDPLLLFLHDSVVAPYLYRFATGNEIVFNLCVGIIASIIMFFLVVRLPEKWKRGRLRKNLERAYASFKDQSISLFLGCIETSYRIDQIENLKDQKRFRDFFKEPYTDNQDKWDGVANAFDERKIKALVVALEILMNEFQYTTSAVDVADEDAFAFFKRISQVIYGSKNWGAEYDDVKSILALMWSLHTGWNFVDGYTGRDIVADMIAKI